ncbi:MAG TPA: APC family permease [Kofleriaceae bacterium]|jgi:amino acid transporter|nr:APC family permease [Kofleriaceae bacterium]
MAEGEVGLRRNAVGPLGAVIMSAAIMGPAVSTFFNPQYSTPFSGAATPLVYVICVVAMLLAASGMIEMARELPSAGAFYTYVTRGLGPRAGFITGGLMFVAYALLAPAEIGLIGSYLQTTFEAELGVHLPWAVIGMVPAIAMVALAYRGITASLTTALVLFTAEVAVIVVLSLIVVGSGGAEGVSLHPLSPAASPHGTAGLATGFVFAALSFVGFEAATTLSEEVERPRRTVPLALLLSVVGVGALYVFCIWAEVIGLGERATNELTGASTPWNDLATRYASWMKWPVVIASVSSMFAVMVNSANGIVRILHTMGREQLLPRALAEVHPRHRTPTRAVLVVGGFSVVVALGLGGGIGGLGDATAGSNVYGYLGFLLTLGILPVYVLTNLAAIAYFRRAGRLHVVRHAALPIAGAVLMVVLLVEQIVQQTDPPYTWFPWVIVGWVAALVAVALWIGARRPEALSHAGAVLGTGEVADDARELPS